MHMIGRLLLILAAVLWPALARRRQLRAGEEWVYQSNNSKGGKIKIRRVNDPLVLKNLHPGHSCYEAEHETLRVQFCYPYVLITGIPKAGTSAVHSLIEKHPNFVTGIQKELCVDKLITVSSVWTYFQKLSDQLKKAHKTSANPAILLSGCIHSERNLPIRDILRQPSTNYIIMTRDFSDLLWASYNFWCHEDYDDPVHCPATHWVDKEYHYRSPEMFHEMILAQIAGKTHYGYPHPLRHRVVYPPAHGMYRDYTADFEKAGVPLSSMLLLASEELSSNATAAWGKIVSRLNIDDAAIAVHPGIGQFEGVRVNTGDHKGANAVTDISKGYMPGVYAVSGNMPLLNKTRSIINDAWREDCMWTSRVTGHPYAACLSSL